MHANVHSRKAARPNMIDVVALVVHRVATPRARARASAVHGWDRIGSDQETALAAAAAASRRHVRGVCGVWTKSEQRRHASRGCLTNVLPGEGWCEAHDLVGGRNDENID